MLFNALKPNRICPSVKDSMNVKRKYEMLKNFNNKIKLAISSLFYKRHNVKIKSYSGSRFM
jgi:hypothetical protein